MRKPIIGLMFLVIAATVLIVGCGQAPENVMAKVGKYEITADDLEENIQMLKQRWTSPKEAYEGKMAALDRIVERKLMLLEAYDRGLDKDSTVLKSLEQGETRRKLIGLWEKEIVEKTKVSDAELKERYDKMGYEYNAAHILVKDSSLAWNLYDSLQQGKDFAELAKKYSEDPGSGAKGGDLGWFTVGRMVEEFENAVMALEDGEISKPVETRFGWHIIKRKGMRERKDRKPFEEEKERIKQMVERQKQTERMEEYLEGLFERYNFTFNEDVISKVSGRYANPEDPSKMSMEEKDLVLATWDGGEFTVGQLDSLYMSQPPYRRPPITNEEQLQEFVKQASQEKLLLAETERVNITEHEKYKEAFKNELEEAMLRQIQSEVYSNITLNDPELKEYYEANTDSFMEPKTIVAKEVQLSSETEAQDVASKVRGGADITEIAADKSERSYLKARDWELEITEARFPDLYAAVENASVGDVVGPVKDNRTNKWSVLKVVNIREAAPMAFERVKGRIKSKLGRQKRQEAMEDFLEKVRAEYSVKVFEDNVAASIDSSAYEGKAKTQAGGQPARVMP